MNTSAQKSQTKTSKSNAKPKTPKVVPYKGAKPFVTVLAGNKGGVGKSTGVKLLATGLANFDANVAVFDLEEPEFPLRKFFANREETAANTGYDLMTGLNYLEVPRNIKPSELKAMIDGLVDTHYVFIDTPAYNIRDGLALLSVADLILCPGRPSDESIEKFAVFLPALMDSFPNTPVRAYWNEVILSESLVQEIIKETAGQALFNCPVLSTYLTHRAAQTAATKHGLTLLEYQKPSDPGYENFMTFLSEFCSMSREIAIAKNKETA